MNRKTFLVSAYGCEPFRGSEAGVGWNWILQMARCCDLHVIARSNDKKKIELNLPQDLSEHIVFHYYDCSFLMRFKHGNRGLYFYYFFWQLGILRIAKEIIRHYQIDYTMHLTFGSYWMPTFLPFLQKPFIYGPMGGGDVVPISLMAALPFKEKLNRLLAIALVRTSYLNPLVVFPCKKASVILCRTENNRLVIPKRYRHKARIILETAIEDEVIDYGVNNHSRIKDSANVKIIMSGRLIPLKNVEMGLRAFASVHKVMPNVELCIVGDGPCMGNLRKSAAKLGLAELVTFAGRLERKEALFQMRNSDIFLFPSLKEGGSWALLEGMSVGLPVVCLDWTGMHDIMTPECGFMISPGTYKQTLASMTEALSLLVSDSQLRRQMGNAAHMRVASCFRWESKGQFFKDLMSELERQDNEA